MFTGADGGWCLTEIPHQFLGFPSFVGTSPQSPESGPCALTIVIVSIRDRLQVTEAELWVKSDL